MKLEVKKTGGGGGGCARSTLHLCEEYPSISVKSTPVAIFTPSSTTNI